MNIANITRIHNITFSIAYMRRMISLLEDYSNKRKVFGKVLASQPLHLVQLSQMKFTFEGNFLMLLQILKMHSKLESEENYKNKEILRILLPMAKLFSGRCSEEVSLEGIQSFGGVGYMENSSIPQILRDTIVTSIWEGSINILSLDFLKVIHSRPQAFKKIISKIGKRLRLL
jgi:putative acyl-CoA dehydrogenase